MMKNILFCIFLFYTVLSFAQSKKEMVYAIALKQNNYIETNQFDSVTKCFSPFLKNQLSTEKLAEICKLLPYQFGKFDSIEKTDVDTLPGFYTTTTLFKFRHSKIALFISFDNDLKISVFDFRKNYQYIPPVIVNTLKFTEHKIFFGKAPYIISGMLTIPNDIKNPPCVIIIGSSGPNDMDMTYGDNKMYKDLAWELACKGIAVFRYDKRTFNLGSQILTDKYAGKQLTLKEEYLDDAKFAIEYILNSGKVDSKNIFLIGHDQGGMMAPLIAKQNKKIAGVIMMAANARPTQDVMTDQIDFLINEPDYNSVQKSFYIKTKQLAVKSKNPKLKPSEPEDSMPGATASYWISVNNYHQIEIAKNLNQPIYVLQGERDYHVGLKDFEIWKNELSERNRTFKLYPKLNHHFMEGEGAISSKEYDKRNHVPDYVADDIAGWIKEVSVK